MSTSSAARQFVTWAPLAALLIVLLPALATAQEPAPPAVSAPDKPERLLALDIFGGWASGYATIEAPGTGEESSKIGGGWEVGATVVYGKRWLGIKSTVSRTTSLDVPVWQITAGPQVYIGKAHARWLVHALVGFATTSGVTPSRSSVVGVVGGDWIYSSFGSRGTTSGSVSMDCRRTTAACLLEWSCRCASEHAGTTMSPVSSESDLDLCSCRAGDRNRRGGGPLRARQCRHATRGPSRSARRPSRRGRVYTQCAMRRPSAAARCRVADTQSRAHATRGC